MLTSRRSDAGPTIGVENSHLSFRDVFINNMDIVPP